MALATSRLGSIGAWQSGMLFLTYTASGLLGATYVVKRLGARDSLIAGMALYIAYVGCFLVATKFHDQTRPIALTGAAIGGVGAGFLWTAQGAYFGRASEEHARHLCQPVKVSTASLAGIFAFIYLAEEVLLRLLSTLLLGVGIASWEIIFGVYTFLTVISAMAMACVHNYPNSEDGESTRSTFWYQVTAAWQVLKDDPKMKYMIGLNAVFGLTSAFLNSYVNGEVVPVALNDPEAKYNGVLNSLASAVAASMSLLFGRVSPIIGRGPVLIFGACCFFGVVFPFLVEPQAQNWGWPALILVYSLHGTGRATFEGTLKATFADYFSYEKEGAFANIILQNGLSGAVGYVSKCYAVYMLLFLLESIVLHLLALMMDSPIVTFSLLCDEPSRYCIEYSNGTLHDVASFELIIVFFAIIAILGYWRASVLYHSERVPLHHDVDEPLPNTEGLLA
jgi:MFS family permease